MGSVGLGVLTAALLVVGLPLVVAPARTDRYFSWTMDVPLTAAFLGASYWTAAVFTLLSAREREWARARSVMPGVLVAGTRSEEHTSELQSLAYIVCRLLLDKTTT